MDYYREIITNKYEIPFKTIETTSMKVGGYVFEDYPQNQRREGEWCKRFIRFTYYQMWK